jgi:hypothetical protein
MHIKELEERSRLQTRSESERNKTLTLEAADLRKEMLRLRSEVLKISASLNHIRSEVGKILDVQRTDEINQERAIGLESGLGTNAEHITIPGAVDTRGRQEHILWTDENISSTVTENTILGSEFSAESMSDEINVDAALSQSSCTE